MHPVTKYCTYHKQITKLTKSTEITKFELSSSRLATMSSRLWAVNATKKKKNELVPGSLRWITNEMSLQYDSALTNCEDHFQDCSSRYDSLSSFVQKVLDITNSTEDHTEDLSLLLAVLNPTVFSPEFSKSTTFVQPTEPEDMYSSNPVSYTHLDVYKRQQLNSTSSRILANPSKL